MAESAGKRAESGRDVVLDPSAIEVDESGRSQVRDAKTRSSVGRAGDEGPDALPPVNVYKCGR
jgi:hypothetical protein